MIITTKKIIRLTEAEEIDLRKAADIIYNLQGSKRVVKKYLPLARFLSNHNLVIRYPRKDEDSNFKEVIF